MNKNISALQALEQSIEQSSAMLSRLPELADDLAKIADICSAALRDGNKLLFCGNGGSAAECQHLATEFVVRLSSQRERAALAAMALTTDTSLLTACSNDYGFDRVFARQVEALMQKGDVLILLSTSGKSPNLIEAAKSAKNIGGIVVAFLGNAKTPLDDLSDYTLHIPSPHSPRVQEAHLICGHLLVELTEDHLMGTTA